MTLTFQLAREGKTYNCGKCGAETQTLAQGMCNDCYNVAQREWTAMLAVRQDPAQFDMAKLVNLLLTQHWQHHCQIVQEDNPLKKGQQKWVVRFVGQDGEATYLRHSCGPLQGYSWDIYGDDMHSPELALLALSQSIPPVRVGSVIPTRGH